MVHRFTLTLNSSRDNENEDATSCDWPADEDLTGTQRARCRDLATPRVGHGRRLAWPGDEVRAALKDERP